ncbi:MAG TPA: type IV toxin-antitoxin system AbiEi family antitoxin domain-containing protein [Solirubrobacteraceae bacterium]|nr:type IV toxin-antitoxin system AbiEi family antitoxin domain-containing protein [Solirubrobacteraceae bacterium]
MADRQHGHVTREQLLTLGLSARAIAARVRAGKLIRVHAGVYAVGAPRRTALARAAAAVLACGPQAALSHESALALWGLREWPATPEVTAATEKRRPGIRTHRSTTLGRDVRTEQAVRTTNPVRTIIDIAPRRTDRQLTRLVQNARLKRHLNDTSLRRLLLRCPRLQPLIDPTQNPTKSELEDDFVAWIIKHKLPMPRINTKLKSGKEVDALYEKEKLIVELDGWPYHSGRKSFVSDHQRDSDHRTLGFDTVRYTGEQLTDVEAANLRRRLSR